MGSSPTHDPISRTFSILLKIAAYTWASPWTVFGWVVGTIAGGKTRQTLRRRGTLCIFGPGVAKFLQRCPIQGGALAMTLGHTILACDEKAVLETFEHEYIHVRQYEWFGPFFVPAYFFESGWQWFRGNHPYYDNRFEVQARKYAD